MTTMFAQKHVLSYMLGTDESIVDDLTNQTDKL